MSSQLYERGFADDCARVSIANGTPQAAMGRLVEAIGRADGAIGYRL